MKRPDSSTILAWTILALMFLFVTLGYIRRADADCLGGPDSVSVDFRLGLVDAISPSQITAIKIITRLDSTLHIFPSRNPTLGGTWWEYQDTPLYPDTWVLSWERGLDPPAPPQTIFWFLNPIGFGTHQITFISILSPTGWCWWQDAITVHPYTSPWPTDAPGINWTYIKELYHDLR